MKTLDQIPINELRKSIGSKVRSLKTGFEGILMSISDKPDREDYTIDIDWNNGDTSRNVWYFWCENIELI